MTTTSYLLEEGSDVLVAEVFGDGEPSEDSPGAESIGDTARGLWLGYASLMSWGFPPQGDPRSLWRYHEFDCQMNGGPLGCQTWAQVGVDLGNARTHSDVQPPLPVAPLLTSLEATANQLGDWSFQGAQVVLPLGFQPADYVLSSDAARWFDHTRAASSGVTMDLMMSFGRHCPPDVDELFDEIVGRRVDARPVDDIDADPWPQSLWIRPNGGSGYTATNTRRWHINFTEWSIVAVSWLITVVTERLASRGVDHPVAVSLKRRR